MYSQSNNTFVKSSKGFTLIEVVVATFIVGLALVALANTVQSLTSAQANLNIKYYANLVAANKLTELQLLPQWPELGEADDQVEMARREWFIETEVTETTVESLRRVDIYVGIDNDEDVVEATLTGFLSSSPQLQVARVDWTGGGFLSEDNPTTDDDTDTGNPPDDDSTPINPNPDNSF